MLALLLACALLARLAIPSGWMPAAEGMGLMLCPDFAPEPQAAPAHHGGHHGPAKPDGDDGASGQPCAFTAASLAIDEPPPFFDVVPLPPQPRAGAPALPAAVAVGRGLAAPPPFATGPPVRA